MDFRELYGWQTNKTDMNRPKLIIIGIQILSLNILCLSLYVFRFEFYQLYEEEADLYEPRHDKTCLREFSTRPDTNRPAQPQKLARALKFRLWNLVILYYLGSEKQRR